MGKISEFELKSSARSGKKLFEISWSECVRWYALVRAENKEETRRIWEKSPEKFWLNIDSDGKEIASEPHIEEVILNLFARKRMAACIQAFSYPWFPLRRQPFGPIFWFSSLRGVGKQVTFNIKNWN